jgi:hypothetical protein
MISLSICWSSGEFLTFATKGSFFTGSLHAYISAIAVKQKIPTDYYANLRQMMSVLLGGAHWWSIFDGING